MQPCALSMLLGDCHATAATLVYYLSAPPPAPLDAATDAAIDARLDRLIIR